MSVSEILRKLVTACALLFVTTSRSIPAQQPFQNRPETANQTYLWDDGSQIPLLAAPNLLETESADLNSVPSGTRIKVVDEQSDASLKPLRWNEVEIVGGTQAGTTGWVRPDVVVTVSPNSALNNTTARRASSKSQVDQKSDSSDTRYQVNNSGSSALLISSPSFQAAGSNRPLLAKGTELKLLEERSDPLLPFLKWHRVEVLDGPSQGQTGWISVGAIEELPNADVSGSVATHVIDNEGTGARIVARPSYQAAADFRRDIGTAPLGTGVKILRTQADPALPFLKWHEVEVMTGSMKGKKGWVTANVVRGQAKIFPMVSIRLRTFIPSPMVGMGFESVLNPGLGNIVFGGDDRGFGHNQGSYRSHQNVVINMDPAEASPIVDEHRDWGLTRLYFARQAVHVTGRPIWWLGPKGGSQRPVATLKLSPTKQNLPIVAQRQAGQIVRVHLKVIGANPGEPLSPHIDADVKVYLRLRSDGEVEYRYDVTHDGFPAYELYVEGEEAYTHDPVKEGQTPLSLFGSGEFSHSSDWTEAQ